MEPDKLPLKNIHLPEAIGWWPPAIGWWLLLVLIPLCLVLLRFLYKRITRKTAIKDAKKILNAIQQDSVNDYQKLCKLSVLIRRTAISHYPRTEAASLSGREWLVFFEKPMADHRFTEGVGTLLTEAPYRKSADDVPIEELFSLCEDWLQALGRDKS